MRAVRLYLKNFCQHREIEVEFGPGLTAIVGPNGSGKSNLVGAMKFAVTGDIPSEGTKDSNICQLADETESSFVSFRFQHAGVDAEVVRYLRPTKPSELTIVGEDKIIQDRRINPRIEEILAEKNLINDIVMVDQGDIFGFLSKTPAKRAEAFAKIFQTDQAEVVWKCLGDHIRSRPRVESPVDVDDLSRSLAEKRQRLEELFMSIGSDTVEAQEAILQEASQRAQAYSANQQLRQQHRQLEQQMRDLNGTIGTLEKHIAENETNVQTLRDAAQGSAEAAESAQKLLNNLEHIERLNRQKQNLRDRIVGLENLIDESKPPEEPAGYGDISLERQTVLIEATSNTVHNYEQLLESFDEENGLAECPTCHTPVDNIQHKLEEARRELPAARINLENLRDIREQHYQYQQRKGEYDRELARHKESLHHDRMALAELETAPPMPEESPEQLLQKVQEHKEYTNAIAEFDRVVNDGKIQLSRLQGQVEQVIARMTEIGNQIGENEITQDQYNEATQTAVNARTRRDQIAVARQEIVQLEATITGMEQRLADAEAVSIANAITDEWIGRLGPVRDLVHRDAAPRFVSQRNLQRIQNAVNEHLERFDTDFRVRADEGLSFEARFTNGRVIAAERLSGGQKVVLALAFRLAVNFMYSDLGFLSLDEPTAYLDAHHIAGFEPVLNRLREYATSRGLQCIMVTHEQSIAHLFDNVIQL